MKLDSNEIKCTLLWTSAPGVARMKDVMADDSQTGTTGTKNPKNQWVFSNWQWLPCPPLARGANGHGVASESFVHSRPSSVVHDSLESTFPPHPPKPSLNSSVRQKALWVKKLN